LGASIIFKPVPSEAVGIDFVAPVDGSYQLRLRFELPPGSPSETYLVSVAGSSGEVIWQAKLDRACPESAFSSSVPLKKDDYFRVQAKTLSSEPANFPELVQCEAELRPNGQ
jgi:hypothetical protein